METAATMEPLGTVGAQIGRTLARLAGRHIATRLLGPSGERALEAAMRAALTEAAAEYPELSAISADIDLLADERVANELLSAALPEMSVGWEGSRLAWRDIYGTDPPERLPELLQRGAWLLRDRMEHEPALQLLWVALSVGQVSTQVAAIDAKVDAVTRPELAMQLRAAEIGSSVAYALELAAQLATHASSGPLGQVLDLRMQIEKGGVQAFLVPKPGEADALTLETEDPTSLARAIESGDTYTAPVSAVRVGYAGLPIDLPREGTVAISRVPTADVGIFEFATLDGLRQRFVVVFEQVVRLDEILLTSTESRPRGLHVSLRMTPTARDVKLRLNEAETRTLNDQVALACAAKIMASGGTASIEFIEKALTLSQPDVPNAEVFRQWGEAYGPLQTVRDLRAAAGARGSVEPIRTLPATDVVFAEWALKFLKTGAATISGMAGTLRLTLPERHSVSREPGRPRWFVRLTYDEFSVPLASGPVPVGVATLVIDGAVGMTELAAENDGTPSIEVAIDVSSELRLEPVSDETSRP